MEQIDTVADENGAVKVIQVVLKIGVMSGVEPHLLEIAFITFKEKTICEDAELVINLQPLTVICSACDIRSELAGIEYRCTQCGSVDIEVVDGEEMYLMRLEMQ